MARHVLHLITGLHGGGAEALLYSLLAADAGNGDSHAVVSMLDGGPYAEHIRNLGVSVHSLSMRRGRPSWRAVREFRRVCAKYHPEIIQSWMYHANVLSVFAGTPRTTGLIWCLHAASMDMSGYHPMSRVVRTAGAVLSGVPDVIVANSEVTRVDHARMGYRPRRWATIPNGFDVARFRADCEARAAVRAELDLPETATLIGLVGRYDRQKDIPTFLQAAAQLAGSGSTAKFLLVGHQLDADNSELMGAVAALGLARHVYLLGFRSDIPRITAALDVATSTSISESFSNAIAEAMACEVPCVVTDAANLPSLVGDAGIVVPQRDAAAVARAWSSLLELGDRGRREMGRRGRHRIEASFSLPQMIGQYQALYQEVHEGRLSRG